MCMGKQVVVNKVRDIPRNRTQTILKSSGGRYERKFIIPYDCAKEVETVVKLHPNHFKEIFYQRRVNNIYYDTRDMKFYHDNVDGATNRIKARILSFQEKNHA